MFVDQKGKRIEFAMPNQIGNGLSGRSFANPASKCSELFFGRDLVIGRLEFNSLAPNGLGQQDFSIQAGRLRTVLVQEFGCPFEQPFDRP